MRFGWWAAGAVLAAGSAQASDKTPCSAGMVCASTPTTVGAAMMRAGYQGLVGKDSVGDPSVESAAAGYKFTVFFYGCENHVKCDSLQFYASFDGDASRGADFANRWNKDHRFAQMAIKPDGTITVSYDVSTIGGLNGTNFADVLDWWSTMLGSLDKFFAANPVPTVARKPAS